MAQQTSTAPLNHQDALEGERGGELIDVRLGVATVVARCVACSE